MTISHFVRHNTNGHSPPSDQMFVLCLHVRIINISELVIVYVWVAFFMHISVYTLTLPCVSSIWIYVALKFCNQKLHRMEAARRKNSYRTSHHCIRMGLSQRAVV